MKTLIEKLPLAENTSYVARTFTTPYFEVPWHQHIEYELILFLEGEGLSFIGNYAGEFKPGDVFFIGKNVPHTFQKREKDMLTSAVVVQFREDFWGEEFIKIPELREIQNMFQDSMQGLQVVGNSKIALQSMVRALEHQKGIMRILKLLQCLQVICEGKEYLPLSTQEVKVGNAKDMERIDKVFRYTIDNFQERITLEDIAAVAGLSIPAFCNYFKKSTKKTYVDFLNEIRIGYACKLLIKTDASIVDICYESGFNTLANFNKQFLKIKQETPSKYRKLFASSNTRQQNYLRQESVKAPL